MEVSKRLQAVVGQIRFRSLADIGTDHGYIPIYAKQLGIIDKAIATDISRDSLQKAVDNVEKYGFNNEIKIARGNGLQPVKDFNAECISIAGMGGMLIIDILKAYPEIVKKVKQLVLQPQKDIPALRRYIHSIGFTISNEEMLFEDNYYVVLNCLPGENLDLDYSDRDYLLGKILLQKREKVLYSFLNERIEKLEQLIRLMSGETLKGSQRADKRRNELTTELQLCKEVLADEG